MLTWFLYRSRQETSRGLLRSDECPLWVISGHLAIAPTESSETHTLPSVIFRYLPSPNGTDDSV